jgi:quaternary ammonium compound-resistance protein SugE
VWAVALKFADGFTRFWPSAIGLAAAVTSFVMLSLALKNLPVGTAYVVWVGVGAFGVAIAGMLALGENVSAPRLAFLALILVGIVGLKFLGAR